MNVITLLFIDNFKSHVNCIFGIII